MQVRKSNYEFTELFQLLCVIFTMRPPFPIDPWIRGSWTFQGASRISTVRSLYVYVSRVKLLTGAASYIRRAYFQWRCIGAALIWEIALSTLKNSHNILNYFRTTLVRLARIAHTGELLYKRNAQNISRNRHGNVCKMTHRVRTQAKRIWAPLPYLGKPLGRTKTY